jgi:azurin
MHTRLTFRSTAVAVVALAAAAGLACSGGGPEGSAPAAGTPAAASRAAEPPPQEGRPIAITADDSMKFDVTEITAKPGEALTVTLTNTGTTPKLSMGHNWVLLTAGTDLAGFAAVAAAAGGTDFVPQGSDRVIAATKLLGPGEKDSVTFRAPTTPGRYDFICSFPGHYQVGMRGVLIVQ